MSCRAPRADFCYNTVVCHKNRFLTFVFGVAAVSICLARDVVVGTQGESPFLDAEVSTNVAFNAVRSDAKTFEVKMVLSGSVSNCVQVAFGRDADADGDLAPDETDLALGWRGGRYFVEEVADGCRRFAAASERADHARFLHMVVTTDKNLVPKTASFVSESGVCFADIGAQSYLFSTNWNLAKVTRRGAVSASEWCRIVSAYRRFVISVR